MTKAELRHDYKALRATLSAEAVDNLSQQLADQFFADEQIRAHLDLHGAVVHTYLPIRRQHEADTWPIIRRLWAEWPSVPVLASTTNVATRSMPLFSLTLDTLLTENRWGIPEPALPAELPTRIPTLVLVPLLTFDERGHRVGYGGGYYDRFLVQLPAQTVKVGLSFFPPVPCITATELTDIPLTACVEPTRVTWWPDAR